MSLNQYRRLLPPVLQVARMMTRMVGDQSCRSSVIKASCSWAGGCSGGRQGYRRLSASYCTWQHRKQQHSSRLFYHDPFTIGRMTGATIAVPPVSPSAITPLPLWSLPDTTFKECHVRLYSTKPPSQPSTPLDENQNETKSSKSSSSTVQGTDDKEEKLSLVQKFKLMYKQYWYVLIPVHVVTSVVWYGSFFIAAKSGVDIVPWLEWVGASEKILSHLRNSNAGYYAIAYAMYKIATPARYTVTIGGTTISINYLKKRGYIKPVPSSEKLKEMYEGKKEEFIERKEEFREKYQERKEEMVEKYQEKKEEIIEKVVEKKEEIKDRVAEKKGEIRDRVTEKREEIRDRVTEKRAEYQDKMEEKKEQLEKIKKKVWRGR